MVLNRHEVIEHHFRLAQGAFDTRRPRYSYHFHVAATKDLNASEVLQCQIVLGVAFFQCLHSLIWMLLRYSSRSEIGLAVLVLACLSS